ncbi:MAG: hypothetical protein ACOYBY_02700 [Dermatophilaceae bacterium]
MAYQPGMPRGERVAGERFRSFGYEEVVARDKATLDITWLKDDSLDGLDNLPAPDVIAQEVVEDLIAALAELEAVATALEAQLGGRSSQRAAARIGQGLGSRRLSAPTNEGGALMNDLLGILRETELALIRETEPKRMADLSEDDLIALHGRVRRARNKHAGNYRRKASAGVKKHGGRGKARPKNAHRAQKAEVFEDALARVSARLEKAARQSAEELKQARLAAANPDRPKGPAATKPRPPKGSGNGVPRAHQKTTGGIKRDASTKATGARRQAKRDAR